MFIKNNYIQIGKKKELHKRFKKSHKKNNEPLMSDMSDFRLGC